MSDSVPASYPNADASNVYYSADTIISYLLDLLDETSLQELRTELESYYYPTFVFDDTEAPNKYVLTIWERGSTQSITKIVTQRDGLITDDVVPASARPGGVESSMIQDLSTEAKLEPSFYRSTKLKEQTLSLENQWTDTSKIKEVLGLAHDPTDGIAYTSGIDIIASTQMWIPSVAKPDGSVQVDYETIELYNNWANISKNTVRSTLQSLTPESKELLYEEYGRMISWIDDFAIDLQKIADGEILTVGQFSVEILENYGFDIVDNSGEETIKLYLSKLQEFYSDTDKHDLGIPGVCWHHLITGLINYGADPTRGSGEIAECKELKDLLDDSAANLADSLESTIEEVLNYVNTSGTQNSSFNQSSGWVRNWYIDSFKKKLINEDPSFTDLDNFAEQLESKLKSISTVTDLFMTKGNMCLLEQCVSKAICTLADSGIEVGSYAPKRQPWNALNSTNTALHEQHSKAKPSERPSGTSSVFQLLGRSSKLGPSLTTPWPSTYSIVTEGVPAPSAFTNNSGLAWDSIMRFFNTLINSHESTKPGSNFSSWCVQQVSSPDSWFDQVVQLWRVFNGKDPEEYLSDSGHEEFVWEETESSHNFSYDSDYNSLFTTAIEKQLFLRHSKDHNQGRLRIDRENPSNHGHQMIDGFGRGLHSTTRPYSAVHICSLDSLITVCDRTIGVPATGHQLNKTISDTYPVEQSGSDRSFFSYNAPQVSWMPEAFWYCSPGKGTHGDYGAIPRLHCSNSFDVHGQWDTEFGLEFYGDRDQYEIPDPEPPQGVAVSEECFIEGTMISMGNGNHKEISQIEIGDLVLSYNENLSLIEYKPVIKLIRGTDRLFVNINFNNGKSSTNTFNHRYFIKDKGWVSYGGFKKNKEPNLKVGDLCLDDQNNWVAIEKIEEIELPIQTKYNFTVKDNHTYFANSVLVHNVKQGPTNGNPYDGAPGVNTSEHPIIEDRGAMASEYQDLYGNTAGGQQENWEDNSSGDYLPDPINFPWIPLIHMAGELTVNDDPQEMHEQMMGGFKPALTGEGTTSDDGNPFDGDCANLQYDGPKAYSWSNVYVAMGFTNNRPNSPQGGDGFGTPARIQSRKYDLHFGWLGDQSTFQRPSISRGGIGEFSHEDWNPDAGADIFPFYEPFRGGPIYLWACTSSLIRGLYTEIFRNVISSFEEITGINLSIPEDEIIFACTSQTNKAMKEIEPDPSDKLFNSAQRLDSSGHSTTSTDGYPVQVRHYALWHYLSDYFKREWKNNTDDLKPFVDRDGSIIWYNSNIMDYPVPAPIMQNVKIGDGLKDLGAADVATPPGYSYPSVAGDNVVSTTSEWGGEPKVPSSAKEGAEQVSTTICKYMHTAGTEAASIFSDWMNFRSLKSDLNSISIVKERSSFVPDPSIYCPVEVMSDSTNPNIVNGHGPSYQYLNLPVSTAVTYDPLEITADEILTGIPQKKSAVTYGSSVNTLESNWTEQLKIGKPWFQTSMMIDHIQSGLSAYEPFYDGLKLEPGTISIFENDLLDPDLDLLFPNRMINKIHENLNEYQDDGTGISKKANDVSFQVLEDDPTNGQTYLDDDNEKIVSLIFNGSIIGNKPGLSKYMLYSLGISNEVFERFSDDQGRVKVNYYPWINPSTTSSRDIGFYVYDYFSAERNFDKRSKKLGHYLQLIRNVSLDESNFHRKQDLVYKSDVESNDYNMFPWSSDDFDAGAPLKEVDSLFNMSPIVFPENFFYDVCMARDYKRVIHVAIPIHELPDPDLAYNLFELENFGVPTDPNGGISLTGYSLENAQSNIGHEGWAGSIHFVVSKPL